MSTISIEEADEIVDGFPIARQDFSRHRWYTKQLVVFRRDGQLMGFWYLKPASELQEDQYRYVDDPVPVFPVVGEEVTTTVYRSA